MRITNAKVYIDGRFVDGGIDFDEKINAIGESVKASSCGCDVPTGSFVCDADEIVLNGEYIIPGLVDIHTHGAMNEDSSDGKAEAFTTMGRYYAKRGVTSFLPTTVTISKDNLIKAVKTIASYERPAGTAKIAGIHLEGPFLSLAKKGAQNETYLMAPDYEFFMELYEASAKAVKTITVAPEEKGALEFIEKASKLVTVSIGHTACDYDTAMAAFKAGATRATHLYNGMVGIHHREPGPIAAAFDSGANVELICDGFHIHPSVVRMTHALFGDRLCLISDSVRCAGMPDGEYTLGGLPVTVKAGKTCLTGTNTISGSSIHLMDGLLRSVSFGIPLENAIYAATMAPAKAVGLDAEIGSLKAGKCADFVILDRDLNIKAVYIDGQRIE